MNVLDDLITVFEEMSGYHWSANHPTDGMVPDPNGPWLPRDQVLAVLERWAEIHS